MPFFSRREPEPVAEPEPTPVPEPAEEERPRRHGFFSGRRDPSPTPSARTTTTTNSSLSSMTYHTSPGEGQVVGNRGGTSIFRRSTDAGSAHKRSLLHRSFGNGNNDVMDPSIVQARERVLGAEAAEKEADRALEEARRSVREARDHVKRLEEEAKEEARRAKIKQYHAREVSKRGKALGRKCHIHGPTPFTVTLINLYLGHGDL
jgi:hypothetical protein